MGLFNTVKINKGCPKCGADVEWQSKGLVVDGIYPVDNFLGKFELNERISGEVHTWCEKCNTSTDLFVVNGKVIEDGGKIRELNKSAEKFINRAVKRRVW